MKQAGAPVRVSEYLPRLTMREIKALKVACHFALDDDAEPMPTRGPTVNAMRRALKKLEARDSEAAHG